jgi:hypothetical protein
VSRPKWTKDQLTWSYSQYPYPKAEYDPGHAEFTIYAGIHTVRLPLDVIKDLLGPARLEVVETTELQRVQEALIALQDEKAAVDNEYLEWHATRKDLSEDFRAAQSNIRTMIALYDKESKAAMDLRFKVIELEKENARLAKGMGELITSAGKEIDRLKQKAGEK